jgi:SAM-dependent methyltransferase
MADWTDRFFTGSWMTLQRRAYSEEETAAQARFLGRALRLRKGSRVADVPCGDGRISLELARVGCLVTGVDACEASVRRARRRFRREGLEGDIRLGDMRSLDLEGPFDAVFNWWGSFGYFDERTNRAVLESFARALRPRGHVLVEQMNREHVRRSFRHTSTSTYDGLVVRTRNVWNPRTQRIEGSWTLREGARTQRRTSSMRIYTPRQMERLLARAGLRMEKLYGDIDLSPYRRGSRRMIAVARKA